MDILAGADGEGTALAGRPRPALLAVCTAAPWPVDNGYSLRVFNQLQQLAAEWDITLVGPPLSPDNPFPPGILRYVPAGPVRPGAYYPWRFDGTQTAAAVSAAVAAHPPDRALVWRGAEGLWLDRPDLPPAVCDLIDCTTLDLWRTFRAARGLRSRLGSMRELLLSTWYARRTARRFSSVVCAGATDARWLETIGRRANVHVVFNGVALPDLVGGIAGAGTGDARPAPRVIFLGSLDFAPNVDAAMYLVNEIWPLILAARPDAELVIAGRNPLPAIMAHHGSMGVSVHANVPDVFPLLRSCQVSITPMRLGSGVKNKVLESWAAGLPVVLTPLAVNGITLPPGHEGLVHAAAADLARAVVGLLDDPDMARRLGAGSRRHAEADYSWRVTTNPLDRLLREATGPSRTARRSSSGATPGPPVLRGAVYGRLAEPPGPPRLFVVVDTEAEFNWGRPFERRHSSVKAMAAVERGQAVFDRHGVRPIYVIDYPVASQPDGYEPLRAILARGGCEIGAHLHPWTNPPFEEEVSTFNSFAGNLPRDLERRKLDALLAMIEQNLGVVPRFFKAGRYGIGPHTMELIAERGIAVDFSIMPGRDFRAEGGPDFRAFDSRTRLAHGGRVVASPMTRGPVGRLSTSQTWLLPHLESHAVQVSRLPGLLARLGLIEIVTLTPEGTPADRQIDLVRSLAARGQTTFVLHYHSPSLAAGYTPYARTPADAARIVKRLETVVAFFTGEMGGVPGDPADLVAAATGGA